MRPVAWDTFTETLAHMSADVGGLYLPALDVLDYSVKFCAPLLFQNDNENFPMSVGGSCFLFRFRGRSFQIATQHQISNTNRNPAEVRIALPEHLETHLLSPAKSFVRTATIEGDPSADFRIWEYDTSLDKRFSKNFVRLSQDDFLAIPPSGAHNVIVYYTVAFPSNAQKIELDEAQFRSIRMRTNWAKIQVVPDPNALRLISDRVYMRCADPISEMGLSPDGFSGAPIFAVYQKADLQCRFGFCGLITHGDADGRLAVFPASELFSSIRTL